MMYFRGNFTSSNSIILAEDLTKNIRELSFLTSLVLTKKVKEKF